MRAGPKWMKTIFSITVMVALVVFGAQAQDADQAPPPMPGYESFTAAQVDQLVGPIALYPDPLISIILPAATFPTQIVLADRYVSGGGDPNQIDQQPWDPSVQALAHYPDVLKWMDDNLTWTTQLGEAFQNQQQDVINAIQSLRLQAYNLGNLQSTPQLQVVDDNGYIEILPVNPDQVPVPQYEPNEVYYQAPYGTPYVSYYVSYPIGPWLCFDFDWSGHRLIRWDHDHPRPNGWWNERPADHDGYFRTQTAETVWHPANRSYSNNGGDRGWNNQQIQPQSWSTTPAPRVNEQVQRPNPQEKRAGTVPNQSERQGRNTTPATPPPQHYEVNNSTPPNNAFIGIQNTHETQNYSDRGYQSIEATHPSSWFHAPGAPAGVYHGGGGSAHPAGGNRGAPQPSGGFQGGGGGRR